MDASVHDLLLRSFDEELTAEEKIELDEVLANSAAWRLEEKRIRFIREKISAETSRSFSPVFPERVMRRIRDARKASTENFFADSLVVAFRSVAVTAAVIIVVLLSINAVRNDGAVMAGVLEGVDLRIEEVFSPTYPWIQE
ncbi:MAG TPA: hypothetical protein ENN17_00870 [bacterium]|nr:hypothetical protein [bacterium]